MRVLLQRVSEATVSVDGREIGRIGHGYVLFLGVMRGDTEREAEWLARKVVSLRLFAGTDGRINDRSLLETAGEVLVVSQFTLAADTRKGNRPDYTAAEVPEQAERLYRVFADQLRALGVPQVATGEFGAHMAVALVNDGPVTILLERTQGAR